jgi:hypothetical protein
MKAQQLNDALIASLCDEEAKKTAGDFSQTAETVSKLTGIRNVEIIDAWARYNDAKSCR